MAISDRRRHFLRRASWLAGVVLALGLAVAALHGSPRYGSPRPSGPAGFAWLRPASKPAGWRVAATSTGAMLAYPGGWHSVAGDAGTATAAPTGPRGSFAGYLNATPQDGKETLANWSGFRVAHVADEGARHVRLNAAATGLHFRGGRGSCVTDSYSTEKARFREIACIVAGPQRTTVVVAAAPVSGWTRRALLLERALDGFSA